VTGLADKAHFWYRVRGPLFWTWILVMLGLYVQTFESIITLLIGALSSWLR
jgi:hypothetical protein